MDKQFLINYAKRTAQHHKEMLEFLQNFLDQQGAGQDKNGNNQKQQQQQQSNLEMPKKPLTSYLQFCRDYQNVLKRKYPNLNFTEVSAKCTQKWHKMSPDEKMLYQEKFNKDRKEYIRLLTKLKKDHPEIEIKIPKIRKQKIALAVKSEDQQNESENEQSNKNDEEIENEELATPEIKQDDQEEQDDEQSEEKIVEINNKKQKQNIKQEQVIDNKSKKIKK